MSAGRPTAEPDAFGRQPRPRPAAPAAQRSAVPEDAQGRRADGARDGTGRSDRGRAGAGARASSRPPSRSIPPGPRAGSRSARPTAFRPCSCRRCSPSCGGARPASTSACASCFQRRERRRPSAPGGPPLPNWRRARWISRSFPPTTSRRASTQRTLYEEDFVVAMRAGHPFADDPTLDRYCEMQHLVVSLTGDRSWLRRRGSGEAGPCRGGSR